MGKLYTTSGRTQYFQLDYEEIDKLLDILGKERYNEISSDQYHEESEQIDDFLRSGPGGEEAVKDGEIAKSMALHVNRATPTQTAKMSLEENAELNAKEALPYIQSIAGDNIDYLDKLNTFDKINANDSLKIKSLSKLLQKLPKINDLGINPKGGDEAAQEIVRLIEDNPQIKGLRFDRARFCYKDEYKEDSISSQKILFGGLADLIKKGRSFDSLSFNFSKINDDSISVLTSALNDEKSLPITFLDLSSCFHLSVDSIDKIANSIENNKIRHLDLKESIGYSSDGKPLNDDEKSKKACEMVKVIAKAVAKTTLLDVLDLSGLQIGPEGAKELAQAIRVNKSLKRVYLNNNEFGKEGLEILYKAIEASENITDASIRDRYSHPSEDKEKIVSKLDDLMEKRKEKPAKNLSQPSTSESVNQSKTLS